MSMEIQLPPVLVRSIVIVIWSAIALLVKPCSCSTQNRQIAPGFEGSEMNWIDHDGLFLFSNGSIFAFGFTTYGSKDTTSFLLQVIHLGTSTVVWTANRGSPVTSSDNFVFDKNGNAYLESGGTTIWSTSTSGKGATSMLLQDSGNLVVLGSNISAPPLWQSFGHPTDTLLSGQIFADGMTLVSKPNSNNLSYHLRIDSGDMILYADFRPPQPYWSLQQDSRKVINKIGGGMHSATLVSNSWNFYDQKRSLLWQFVIASGSVDANGAWAAVLGVDGFISFYSLDNGGSGAPSSTKIPQGSCDTPEPCGPYYICESGTRCQCPSILNRDSNCNPDITSPCSSETAFMLAKLDDGVGYFATRFLSPSAKSNLTGCTDACTHNCSCVALFHDSKSGDCFLFNQIGSLQQSAPNVTGVVSFIKIASDGGGNQSPRQEGGGSSGGKHSTIVVIISLATAAVIAVLIYFAIRIRQRKRLPEPSQGSSEEDNFLEGITGMPVRLGYRELQEATDNFSIKLGQGGFGSVYLGKLPDGTQVAVKKLEGIGQGRKEFRSEVAIIGSIHHFHLVRLRGFCAEGMHRLLAYEYLAKGSLDRWIFQNNDEGFQLDWDKRYNIALGTAKGLAYLHEDCDSKIIHCDIKPENVLLDENYIAKVSDFGLAKLMTREQSHVFTTLRGTRGYLAPEWITNYAISEKSDVYSFGMVLLEIIGGRKNFDPAESSEKAHFPSYAFKKMEEGKLKEVFDAKLKFNDEDERVETAIKVALWCIQEDLSLRPSMTKVVQMLEGLLDVPQPPTSSQMGFRLYANVFKSTSEEGTSSGPSDCNSDAFLSAVRLSGPR
ncbi:G-type lectin S-receptor-like serine/threonine-protein kinase SD2-5 isoform X2 [Phoenix dactylifera]|uniref:Receptor-like serine/threonine-protein kinase n=1 Tax=Phoenix dactylifera TaxID=42345 RepID=A0A8B9AL97_PHODC|nr:G-type lectin S-receptor-like serine/threonine-protein kinase SD2-5 isoform X2 [Phoenix dactylifera]